MKRRILILVVLAMTIAACGGSSSGIGGGGGGGAANGPASDPVGAANGPANDPVGAVNGFIDTIKADAFDNLPALVCAAKKDEILGGLTGGSSSAAQAFLGAVSFDSQNGNVQQKSVDGDNAVVHVTGQMVTTVDAGKAKDLAKQVMGDQVTDDQMNQMVAAMNTSHDVDQDVNVVKENGGWVVCSDLGSSG